MAASKQASKHTHAHVQCSPTSVGLAQARPNYIDEVTLSNWKGSYKRYLTIVLLNNIYYTSTSGYSGNGQNILSKQLLCYIRTSTDIKYACCHSHFS